MQLYAVPAIATLALWWAGTALVLFLDLRPRRTHRLSITAATLLLVVALYLIATTANDPTPRGAYLAFAAGVIVWGWQEMLFLMGFVTGPRRTPCPPGARGWRRFRFATGTLIHHEIALLVTTAVIAAIVWNTPNTTALWTFVVLWVMRLSAKFNLFFGVRNRSEELLPEHLRYLETYFARQTVNAFFPWSVSLATVAAALLWNWALTANSAFDAVSTTLVATLLALGVLEHWFLVLPVSLNGLWQRGDRSKGRVA